MKIMSVGSESACKMFKFQSSRGDFFMVGDKLPLRVAYDSNFRVKQMVDMLKVGTLKSFNVQINVIERVTDDKTGEVKDKVSSSLYQCNVNNEQLKKLREENNHIVGLLELLTIRSKDVARAISESIAAELVKFSSKRIDSTTKNSVKTFSLAVTFWK